MFSDSLLEDANLKLASVVTDIYGVSARAVLEAILAGQRDVEALADLARGRLRAKRDQLKEALEGRVTAHHSFLADGALERAGVSGRGH